MTQSYKDRKRYKRRLKSAAIAFRGGKCENPECPLPYHPHWGEDMFQFDHIKGDGSNRRKGVNDKREVPATMHNRILRDKAPDIQMLCCNCHHAKTLKELRR